MKILIIEDQEIKRNEIKALAESIFDDNCKTQCIADYRPAMASIAFMDWDLILLDMSFETMKGTDDESGFQSLAGLQVLQHMRRLNKNIPVVIITSHTEFNDSNSLSFKGIRELDEHIKQTFDEFYKGTVLYKQNSNEWKIEVRRILSNVFN